MRGRGPVRTLVALLALLSFSAPALAQKHKDFEDIGRRDINKGSWNFYSLEKEIQLGQQFAAQLEAQSGLVRDPVVVGFVDDLVQNLARHSDARLPFTVKVIDSDEVNAFALPGGFLYVTTGLILEARTEAELAGLLAHEMAHVTARHATKQASKQSLFQWMTLPLVFIGGPVGMGIQQALGLAVPMTFLKFRRNAEREADFLGLQYAYLAGYDPTGMIDYLERMKGEQGGRLARLFSSHPMTKDRIQRAQKGIAEVLPPREEYVVSTSRFDGVRAYLKQRQEANWIHQILREGEPRLRRRTETEEP
ncbi:MAG: M48 family metallopeptidase [Candidatus Acidoferrales bacterium]